VDANERMLRDLVNDDADGFLYHYTSLEVLNSIASPDYPEWALARLQGLVADAGLHVTVEKSDLLALPEGDKIPHVGGHAD
jgi:hypothetical protein